MISLKLGLAVAGCIFALGGVAFVQHQSSVIAKQKASIAQLNGYVAGYEKAQKTELEIHVTQEKLKVQVNDARQLFAKDDPKCADSGPLVGHFVDSIAGMRKAETSPDHSAKPD